MTYLDNIKCHVCKSLYEQIMGNTFLCKNCKHIYRKYNGNNLKFHEEVYRSGDPRFTRHNNEFNADSSINENFHKAREAIVTKRKNKIKQYLSKELTFFDIGAGAGTFLRKIKNDVREVSGNELDQKLINEMNKFCDISLKGDFLSLNIERSFDLVSAWHVLEHIEDLDTFAEKAEKIFKKYLFIEIPTIKSYFLNNQRTRQLIPVNNKNWDGHVHYFSKKSFEMYVKKRFKIIEIMEGVQSPAIFAILEKK